MHMALQQPGVGSQCGEKDQGSTVSANARSSSEAVAVAVAAAVAPAAAAAAAVVPAVDSCRVSPNSNRSSCSPRSAASTPRSRLRSSSNSPRRSLAVPATAQPEQHQHQRQRHVLPQLDLNELQRQQQQLQDLQQLKGSCHPHAGLDSDDWQLLKALLTGGRQAASTAAAAACTAPPTASLRSGSGSQSARELHRQQAGSSSAWPAVPGSSSSKCSSGERLCHSSREGPLSTRSVTAGGGGCRTCRCSPGSKGPQGPSGTCRAPQGAIATSLPGHVTLKQAAAAACGSRLNSRGGCSHGSASAAGAAQQNSGQRAGVSAVHDNTRAAAAAAGHGLATGQTLETPDGEQQQQQPLPQEEQQPVQLQAQIGILQTDDPFDWDSIDLVDTSSAAPARATLTCLAAATATDLPAGGLQAAEAQAAALLTSMAGDAGSTSPPAAFQSLQQLINSSHVGSSTCCCQLPAAGCAAFGSVQLLDTSLLQPVPCRINYNLSSTARKHRQHKEGTSSSRNGSSSCRGGMYSAPECGTA